MKTSEDKPSAQIHSSSTTFSSAVISSAVSNVIGFPLDSIKVRQQTYQFPTIRSCFQNAIQHEGWRGLYRGLTLPLVSATFSRSISFTLYDSFKHSFENTTPSIRYFLSGLCTGSLISLFACPFEYSKLYSQIHALLRRKDVQQYANTFVKPPQPPLSSFQSANDIVRRYGFCSLWNGYRYHLARDAFGSACYFAIYETFKGFLISNQVTPHFAYAFSGAFCGALSWILVFPIDTAKSIVQKNTLLAVKTPLSSIPWLSFSIYRGISISLMRSALINSCNFTLFEVLRDISFFQNI
ncbi:carboxylic acid transporter [Schizosaccharomyces cryophilus OY26]|uniref:Carboxylic acid transporter n=1 Tax=Schizosaccharomyces cryophilus (strain OY26 / ATCC MYA-4695 / CBS 11777 / NBRC 106824 / NRRL Y48691) TaxID=653667 RepID=S9VTX5_SCHCR|nr:carboxylic acid transporter [Schizosaccharomyces cryophilus OY26]EPY49629.1 carboxylic acid transporter [Schizosaccharomyces cryophilus OY26]